MQQKAFTQWIQRIAAAWSELDSGYSVLEDLGFALLRLRSKLFFSDYAPQNVFSFDQIRRRGNLHELELSLRAQLEWMEQIRFLRALAG